MMVMGTDTMSLILTTHTEIAKTLKEKGFPYSVWGNELHSAKETMMRAYDNGHISMATLQWFIEEANKQIISL